MPSVPKKITVGPVSIPAEYDVQDAQLFTQKWWAEVTKTNLFWEQFKKYTSRGTINRRIGLEIKTSSVEGTRGLQINSKTADLSRVKKRSKKRQVQHTPSESVHTATQSMENESDYEFQAEVGGDNDEDDQITASVENHGQTGHGRPHRATRNQRAAMVACGRCDRSDTWEHMEFDADSNPICFKCRENGGEQPGDNVTVEVPLPSTPPVQPLEAIREIEVVQLEPASVKVEKEENGVSQNEPTTASATPGIKRERDDDGQIISIHGERWLVYLDKSGEKKAVRLGPPEKKIKIELD